MRNLLTQLGQCYHGAVAPTVALALFGLIAAGGLAFDYAHMAALNSELQNAADQSALAAASQLDGKAGAQSRAIAAAQTLINNVTYFANDAGGTAVTVPTLTFYSAFSDSSQTAATGDADSHFVQVQVGARTANFTLTPIVGVLSSGPMTAKAVAGLGSAICNSPPVMLCNPNEAHGDTSFDATAYAGDGVLLVANTGGGWVPGNFGYLDSNFGNGATGLKEVLGWNVPPGDCVATDNVTTKPGVNTSVTGSMNTRFDIFDSNSCVGGGNCSPSINSTKDVIRPGNGTTANSCKFQNQGWQLVGAANQYLPTSSTTPLTVGGTPNLTDVKAMGYPRDMCHAISSTGNCLDGAIGNGLWDRNAYFYVNYGASFDWRAAMTTAGYDPNNVTRYQVNKWEMANASAGADPRTVSGTGAGALKSYRIPICPSVLGGPAAITPGPTTVDRRRISVAVINCSAEGVNGATSGVKVLKWIDVFLVEPSLARPRTAQSDIYVEVIGETKSAGNGTAGQVVRHDTPYLVE